MEYRKYSKDLYQDNKIWICTWSNEIHRSNYEFVKIYKTDPYIAAEDIFLNFYLNDFNRKILNDLFTLMEDKLKKIIFGIPFGKIEVSNYYYESEYRVAD